MLAHARNVTIHDGNFGTVHGNQYNHRYNGPVTERNTTNAYGDTFNHSPVKSISRNYDRSIEENQRLKHHSGALAIFQTPIHRARPDSPRSHILVDLPSDSDSLPSSQRPGSGLRTPTEHIYHNIDYPSHFPAISSRPANDTYFEHHNFEPLHRNAHSSVTNIYMPSPIDHDNDSNATRSERYLSPPLERPHPAFHTEFTNIHSGEMQTIDMENLESSLRNTEAWVRQTEAATQSSPRPASSSNPFRNGTSSSIRSRSEGRASPSPNSVRRPQAPSEITESSRAGSNWDADDERGSRQTLSDATTFSEINTQRNWDADDERESRQTNSDAATFSEINTECNWDADDEYESQNSERGTVPTNRSGSTQLIKHIQEMGLGFDRRDIIRCMQASNNNPDLAVEYLINGISNDTLKKSQVF